MMETTINKETNVENATAEFESQINIVRSAVETVYDLQGMRIAMGNRIVQSFIQQAAVKPSRPIDEMDSEVKSLISQAVKEYDRVTDAYVSVFDNKGRIQKAIQYLGEDLHSIRSDSDFQMIGIYKGMLQHEAEAVKIVDKAVKSHPMWNKFFKDVTGCGPLMSAVCLSRLNPYKARHVSSFWKYAGLDVVWEPAKTTSIAINPDEDPVGAAEMGSTVTGPMLYKHIRVEWDDERPVYEADVVDAEATDTQIKVQTEFCKFVFPMVEDDTVIKPNKKNGLEEPQVIPGAKIIDFTIDDLPMPIPGAEGRYVGRAKRHLIQVEYTTKDGTIATKNSISYNPKLKSKLMGVLADSFIKCPGCKYEQIYRGYRARLDNEPAHYGKTAAHKHMMAKRYCIKMFLADMWVAWRELEGLPVSQPYAVEKLGMKPHGFNY